MPWRSTSRGPATVAPCSGTTGIPNYYKSILRALGVEPCVAHRPVMPVGRHRKRVSALSLRDFLEHHGYARKRLGAARLDVRIPTLRDFLSGAPRNHAFSGSSSISKSLVPRSGACRCCSRRSTRSWPASGRRSASCSRRPRPRSSPSSGGSAADIPPVSTWSRAGLVLDPTAHSAGAPGDRARRSHRGSPKATCIVPLSDASANRRAGPRPTARAQRRLAARAARGGCELHDQDEREMVSLVELGVAGIQTDRPGLLRSVAERHGKVARVARAAEHGNIPLDAS